MAFALHSGDTFPPSSIARSASLDFWVLVSVEASFLVLTYLNSAGRGNSSPVFFFKMVSAHTAG